MPVDTRATHYDDTHGLSHEPTDLTLGGPSPNGTQCHERCVADVSGPGRGGQPDVTEMSRPNHIFVTRCHKLSQQLSH